MENNVFIEKRRLAKDTLIGLSLTYSLMMMMMMMMMLLFLLSVVRLFGCLVFGCTVEKRLEHSGCQHAINKAKKVLVSVLSSFVVMLNSSTVVQQQHNTALSWSVFAHFLQSSSSLFRYHILVAIGAETTSQPCENLRPT